MSLSLNLFESMESRIDELEAKLAEAEEEIRLLKMNQHFIEKEVSEKIKVAVEALEKIKFESLDDKTPVRYITALMNWRDKVCSISFEALKKIKGQG